MLLVLLLLLLAEAVSRAASELSLGPVIAQVPLSALDTGVIVHYKGKGMRKGRPLPLSVACTRVAKHLLCPRESGCRGAVVVGW